MFTARELEFIASLILKHDTYAVLDEVYEHLVYPGRPGSPFLPAPLFQGWGCGGPRSWCGGPAEHSPLASSHVQGPTTAWPLGRPRCRHLCARSRRRPATRPPQASSTCPCAACPPWPTAACASAPRARPFPSRPGRWAGSQVRRPWSAPRPKPTSSSCSRCRPRCKRPWHLGWSRRRHFTKGTTAHFFAAKMEGGGGRNDAS